MPQQSVAAVVNNFIGGYVTEATSLNFPENACAYSNNCVTKTVGSIKRRSGIDYETAYQVKEIATEQNVIRTYVWKDVSGNGTISFLVVQVGNYLYFYNVRKPDRLSSGDTGESIDLTTFSPSGAPEPKANECQFASGKGALLVTHPHLNPFYVEYNVGSNTFTATAITIEIRDFDRQDDSLDIDERPNVGMGSISDAHLYNLYNQGWTTTNLNSWDASRSDMPSNVDVMWSFKNSSDAFDVSTVANVIKGNSPAPKGHFILTAWDKQRDSVSGVSGIADENTSYHRPSSVAFYAGRAFYSGLSYGNYNTNIYFSQIVESTDLSQFGKCYQINDPTAESLYDLLPSDGGVITIPEAGNIFKLVSVQGSLLVFASNGIWSITGSSGIGFAANDYTVANIAGVQTLSSASFVSVGGFPAWWNAEGIYMVSPSQNLSGFTVASLSDTKIKTFFQDIPLTSRLLAHGAFDAVSGDIRWAYRSTEGTDISEKYQFDKILIYNVTTQAFDVWTVDVSNIQINSLFVVEGAGGNVIEDTVTVSGDQVQVDGDDVIIFLVLGGSITPRFKYFVSANDEFTFAEDKENTYSDWTSTANPSLFSSEATFGNMIRGNAVNRFQANYIHMYSNNAVDSKYYIQARWDYANTGNSGRWSTRELIDNSNNKFNTLVTRRRLRGRGRVLQIHVESFPGEPFEIDGWALHNTVNTQP